MDAHCPKLNYLIKWKGPLQEALGLFLVHYIFNSFLLNLIKFWILYPFKHAKEH